MGASPSTRALHHATELARLVGNVRRLNRQRVSKALAAHQQSLHDWQVLANVKWRGGMSQVELAEHIGAHAASLSRLLDGLQKRGLIRRVTDADDRRCVTVHLTARGESWYARWHRPVMAELHGVMSRLDAQEQGQLERLLRKLLG